jgi:glucose dehydrogenase
MVRCRNSLELEQKEKKMFISAKPKKLFLGVVAFGAITISTHAALNRIRAGDPLKDPGNWPGFNRGLDSQRFSPLSEINTTNVRNLKTKCTFDLGEAVNFQTGPVVVDGTMYLTTENDTYAIDAATCSQVWKYHGDFASLGNHVNRGLTYSNGHIYRGMNDGYLTAFDAKTGSIIWRSKAADATVGENLPAAPVVWNGMVFIGQSGGDLVGIRGRMMAFRESDGQQIWSFDLVPMTGPGSETWPPSTAQVPRTGGATWTSYTVDEDRGLLLIPAGNPAPDFLISARPGDNLYTNSIVILDAKTGELKNWYQLVKNDIHDWDVSTAPVLFKNADGHRMIAEAGKDGYLHVIDDDIQTILFSVETTTRFNDNAPMSTAGTRFCPGTNGGSEWNGAAYHPTLDTLFVPPVFPPSQNLAIPLLAQ